MNAGDPGDGALDAQPKAAVRYAAVAAQVNVPAESVFGQMVAMDALQQQVGVADALAAADDPAVALGGQQVNALARFRPAGPGFHVKGFADGRIAVDKNRAVKLLGQLR